MPELRLNERLQLIARSCGAHSQVIPDDRVVTRPFLKWTGGKQWLIPLFARVLPAEGATYWEPFLGGGSAFFAARPARGVLADTNHALITTYRVVRDQVEELISELSSYPHAQEFFDELRRSSPSSDVTIAARLIYLNKTAFNGIYRVNKKGEFNVPYGRFIRPTICQPDRLRSASVALKSAHLTVGDFETTLDACQPGDVVYLDPPYITGHRNNGFLRYNEKLFSWSDQARLAAVARRLSDSGARVLVTNASHVSVTSLYPSFHRYSFQRNSLISGSSAHRGEAFELIFSNREIVGLTPDPA